MEIFRVQPKNTRKSPDTRLNGTFCPREVPPCARFVVWPSPWHNLPAHRQNGSFPMIGKKFSNGWKIQTDFSNDWKKFPEIVFNIEKHGNRFAAQEGPGKRVEAGGAGVPPAGCRESGKKAKRPMFSIISHPAARSPRRFPGIQKTRAGWSGFRNSVAAVHCVATFHTADAQKRVPPRGERTGGARFRATMWVGNVREATEKHKPLLYSAKLVLARVFGGRAASPFAAVCLQRAWKALHLPSCRERFARRAGDCPPYPARQIRMV